MDSAPRGSNFWLLCGVGAVVVFVLWLVSALIIVQFWPEPSEHGTLGDMFGAINALFSGWAFLGVIVAIILQKIELEAQRHEIREARIAHQSSAVALADQARLSAIRTRIEALTLLIEDVNRQIDGTSGRLARDRLGKEHRRLMDELRKRLDEVDTVSKNGQRSGKETTD